MNHSRFDKMYRQYQPLLFSLAYRMLGTVSDAEDIVQDVFLQIQLSDGLGQVDHEKAYLCKMTTNRCIDLLKSARKKREIYTGSWLPEPLVVSEQDPLRQYIRDETVSFAILIMLEKLTPIERAVFILREAFELPYDTIADVIDKSPQHCRKIFSRLRPKLLKESTAPLSPEKGEEIISKFLHAARTGEMDDMLSLLGREVVLLSDGGGKVSAALYPITKREHIANFLATLMKKALQQPERYSIVAHPINGNTGLLILEDGKISNVFSFSFQNGKIGAIYIVRNPDKLSHLRLFN